jgi:hypothetical protein
MLLPLKRLVGGVRSVSTSLAKTVALQVARLVVRFAENHPTHVIPTPEAVMRFLLYHNFISAYEHLSSFLPQFETTITHVSGLRPGPSAEKKIVNIAYLVQGFSDFTSVRGPFQDPTEVTNLAELSRFVTLAPRHDVRSSRLRGQNLGNRV